MCISYDFSYEFFLYFSLDIGFISVHFSSSSFQFNFIYLRPFSPLFRALFAWTCDARKRGGTSERARACVGQWEMEEKRLHSTLLSFHQEKRLDITLYISIYYSINIESLFLISSIFYYSSSAGDGRSETVVDGRRHT